MDPKQSSGMKGDSKRQHAVLLPLQSAGHFPPAVQLLYQLDSRCPGLIVTITASPNFAADLAELQQKGDLQNIDLRVERLPGILPKDEKSYNSFVTHFGDEALQETEGVRKKLIALKGTAEAPTAVIGDMFHFWCKDFAEDLGGIPWYIFYCCYPAYTLMVVRYHELKKAQVDNRAKTNPEELLAVAAPTFQNAPGAAVLHLADLPFEQFFQSSFQSSDLYRKMADTLPHAAGFLHNTAEELDQPSGAMAAMKEILGDDRVFAVGPGIQMEGFGRTYSQVSTDEVLPWLNKQQENTVLYVAFGSTVVSPKQTIQEVAVALEATGVPFIWALKLWSGSGSLSDSLPEGFLERISGRGLVLTGWLPQAKILQHPAVGGFLSHCGYNSFVESVCAGVPVIGWPSHSDQLLALRCHTQLTKTGVSIASFKRHNQYSFEDITRREIEMAIRTVMLKKQGRALRTNIQKLQKAVATAVQEGGSSYRNVERFVHQLSS